MSAASEFFYLNNDNIKLFDNLFNIYKSSIEPSEQKPYDKLKQLVSRKDYLIRLMKTDSQISGFSLTYINRQKGWALLEYMAVDQNLRSRGLGQQIFNDVSQILKENSIQDLIIEVDSPYEKSLDQELRSRRIQFYLRLGCLEIDKLNYILPLPSPTQLPQMKLLIYKLNQMPTDQLNKLDLINCVTDIYENVYGCDKSDLRLNLMFKDLPSKLNLHKGGKYV